MNLVTVPEIKKKMVKIQFMSDLHIEHFESLEKFQETYRKAYGGNDLLQTVHGDILVLAGDIGNIQSVGYVDFLEQVSAKFQHVMVVAGNHEYYGNEYWSCSKSMKELCASFNNVHFLDRTSLEIECNGKKLVFLGCVLWANVPDDCKQLVGLSMNDYRLISIADDNGVVTGPLSVDDTNWFFKRELEWLEKEVQNAKYLQKQVIIVTHHAPLTKGVGSPYYENSTDKQTVMLNTAFATDCSHLMGGPVILWISGHTHYSTIQACKGTFVASNQLGYLHSSKDDNKFREDLFYEV